MPKARGSKVVLGPLPPAPVPLRTVDCQGNVFCTLNGLHHREDGPAREYVTGRKEWMINGRHHRLDGPAVITGRGDQIWMVDGNYHREEGPAILYHDGRKIYYLKGVIYNEKSFIERIRNIRLRKALDTLEKFSDKYSDSKDTAKAGSAVMKFLQGECDHSFQTQDKACELCDSQ